MAATTTGGIAHAKYWIIDKREIFIGSQNFDWKALTQIHETGVHLIDDRLTAKLSAVFEKDWETAASGQLGSKPNVPKPCKTAPFEPADIVSSPPVLTPDDVCDALTVLLSLINQARDRVWIQVLTYSLAAGKENPASERWTEIDAALRAAAKRGVRVRLMVANWNTEKPAIDHLKDLSRVRGVEIKIVTIPELSSGHIPYARVIHSKYMVVDSSALWLGTSNWSKNYFYNTRGIEMVIRKPEFNSQGSAIFERLWSSPYAALIDIHKNYIPPKKD